MNPAQPSGTKDSAVGARRVDPSRSLLQGAPYVNAASTDIGERFKRMKAEALDFSGPSLRELKAVRKKR